MTGSLDDNSLVRACRAGQTEAFGVLVRRYQDRLYPTLLRLVGSAEDAEDVLQDAFVRAFEKITSSMGRALFIPGSIESASTLPSAVIAVSESALPCGTTAMATWRGKTIFPTNRRTPIPPCPWRGTSNSASSKTL